MVPKHAPGLNKKDRANYRKQVADGKVLPLCLLPERNDALSMKWSVVDFREVVSLPKEYLRRHANSVGNRLRVKPPYREHVAHCFGELPITGGD